MTYYLLMLYVLGGAPRMTNFPMDSMDQCVFVMGKVRGTKEFPANASFVCIELAPEGKPS